MAMAMDIVLAIMVFLIIMVTIITAMDLPLHFVVLVLILNPMAIMVDTLISPKARMLTPER